MSKCTFLYVYTIRVSMHNAFMNVKYKIAVRRGRCVQVMLEGTDKWISTGCVNKKDAVLWIESKIRNDYGTLQKLKHDGFRLKKEKNRNIQVQFDGSSKWLSTGYRDELNATLWAQAKLRERRQNDVTLRVYSEGFYTRTDEMSFRARNIRKNKKYTDNYYAAMNGRLQNYVLPVFGDVNLSRLDHLIIDDWFVTLKSKFSSKPLSSDSKNKILFCLSFILTEAVRVGLLDENPCDKVESIAARSNPREAFSPQEMKIMFPPNDKQAVWVWGELKWACYFQILKCTGFRPGEVAGLRRDNYYPDLGGIYTTHTVESSKRQIVQRIKTTNKGKEYKIGLLSDQCMRLLDEYLKTISDTEEYLFKVNGDYVTTFASNKHFVTYAERAGVEMEGRTQYCLRHTFQTAIAGEIDKNAVEELMGHTKYRQDYDHRDGRRRLQQLQNLRNTLKEII